MTNAEYIQDATAVLPRPDLPPVWTDEAAAWAQSVPGWMSRAELRWLACRASALRRGDTWVEVGSWCGRSLTAVALSVPYGVSVVAVDHWRGSPMEQDTTHADADAAYGRFLETLDMLEEMRPGTLRVIEGESVAAAGLFADESLAAVFVDGGHDYDSVRADLEAWLPRVRIGGILCGHDLNDRSVGAALYDVLGTWKLGTVDSIWCYSKG